MSEHVFSFGGGVQSTAVLVLAAQGVLDLRTFLFANVGDDSEHPATLRYVNDIAKPYAMQHGLDLIEVAYHRANGTPETLYQRITAPGNKVEVIPVRLGSGQPTSRICTYRFKVEVVAKWLRQQGVTKAAPATVALGISLDELQRMRSSSGFAYYTLAYPLIELRMTRQDCINVIERAGLPVPPKSSCWFCPFHRLTRWRDMADTEPDLFRRSVALERYMNEHIRHPKGKDDVFFTDALKPLDKAVGDKTQGKLFDTEPSCDSGYCFT